MQALVDDATRASAGKQALKNYVRQQSAAEYQECPFFATPKRGAEIRAEVITASFGLAKDLNARLFAMARASSLHRLSLFSACVKYLAYLHCREPEGCLAFAIGATSLSSEVTPAVRADSRPTARPTECYLVPVKWGLTPAELAQPVKRLFGEELAQWRRLAVLLSGISPSSTFDILAQPPKVLVGYSEAEVPPAGIDTTGIDTTPYSLVIWIEAASDETRLHLRFDGTRVDAELISLFVERLTLLLRDMVFAPDAELASRPWIPRVEQERVALFSRLAPSQPLRHQNVAQAITASIRDRADTIFLESGELTVNFAQLARYTEALLARPDFLQREQLGECVLIVGTKSLTTTLAAMACMRIGVPFCVQSQSMPEQQLCDSVEIHRTRTVILEAGCRALEEFFRRLGCHVVLLTDYDPASLGSSLGSSRGPLLQERTAGVDALLSAGVAVDPDDALCVVMTSGSEGKPKGCTNTHRALLNLSQEKRALYRSARSRVASMSSHTFDYFVLECVQSLSQDIVLVMVPEETRIDARRCVEFLREKRIDLLFTTTVFAEDIMEQGDIPTLRQLYFGGESLRTFRKNNYQLFNLYGPSETGVLTTHLQIVRDGQKITIGRPFGGYQCAVVFPDTLEPCPVGVPGELLIGGVGVGLGYFNRPDLTQQAFIEADTDGLRGRCYRSGDLCCWDVHGELEILGRRDRQCKVNGFRVELDAIERTALESPAVSHAAVVGVEDRRGHVRLVAFVVATTAQVTEHGIKDMLARRMPGYMVPSQIILVSQLPMTRHGKLDRKALAQAMGDAPQAEVVRPRGPIQQWLAGCWAENLELEVDALSVDRSFFDLGGHSLRAARMLAQVQQQFGQEFSLLEFFKNDTIEELAKMIETRCASHETVVRDDFSSLLDAAPVLPADGRGPLSVQEGRLYAEYCLHPDSRAYLLTVEIPLAHDVSAQDVEHALQMLIERHDVLRTRYCIDSNGIACAEIQPSLLLARVLIEDPSRWSQQRARPLDLGQGPLLRCHLRDVSTQRACLELQVHHIIVDKPSMEILERSFQKLLRREPSTGVVSTAAASIGIGLSYRSYAIALAEARRQPSWARAQAFWKDYLEGLDFDPLGHGAVAGRGKAKFTSWCLPEADIERLKRVCTALNVTPATFFLGLWGLALAHEGSSTAFSISVAKAYRPRRAQETVGLFVSLSPCAFRFGKRGWSLRDFMTQLAVEQWHAVDHHFYPIEEAFGLLSSDPRIFGSNPLLNVAYTYIDTEQGERLTPTAEQPDVEAHGPLNLTVIHTDRVSRLTLEYQVDVFTEARIAAIAAAYQQILQRVLRTPLQLVRVDELIAPAHAEAKALRPARRRATCTPIDVLLTDALLTMAGRTAVIDDDGALTWDEFAALTAAYARVLNTSTIRRALIVGRPGRQLQAFLAACFLTRTTYLALETGTPTQRVQEVIEHAGPDLVVATDAAAVMGIHARLLEEISIDQATVDWRAFRSVKSHDENPIGWILYSSGTTGGPKGICVASHTAAQYLDSIVSALRLERGLRVVQQFSPSFDGYLEEVLLAWALQGTSVVVDRYTLLDERKASAFLARHRPDVLSASPALFSAWNRWPDLAPLPRVCISGGDFLAVGDINRLLERTQVWNSYGPTETCIAVSMVNCARVAPGAAPPIGEPFDHVALAVVDAEGRRLQPGRWGELLIHGDFEHHAYLNDPVLTARKFGRDARETDGGTFFRTGDLAMLDQEGMFHLKGRMDDSCKVRGNFIALGELENRAGQYPGVQAAGAAVAFAGSPEACLVLAFEGNAIVPSGLQQSLARHYPRSHLPAAIFRVERLPRTQTGKLDRWQVVALFQRWKQQADHSVQEHALAEGLQELIACWRDCLGFNGALTLDSDFFVVSGSSLSAVRLASQLQTRFGVAVTPVDIFRNATVGAQWALIKARQGERGTSDGLLQERFLNVDEPGTPHLVLLPPALGGLLELTALAANLNGHVTISVLTVDPSAVEALTEEEFGTMLLHALWACTERHGRHSTRPLWLGGYSMGAEILAALLVQQPALLKNFQKLVLLDPNLRTEVFAGNALYTEFVDFFRSFIHRTDSGAVIGQDTDVEILRRDFPSIYREWRYYELQHRLLGSVTFYERITTLPLVSFPLLLFFSDDADSESIEALQQRLECGAVLHRRRGDHFTFVAGLGPDDFSDAGMPGWDVLSEQSPAWRVSGPASGESPLVESSPGESSSGEA